MKVINSINANWNSCPGATILDILDEKGITIQEFSDKIEKPISFVQRLVIGNEKITEPLALSLVIAIGSTKFFWLNREELYQKQSRVLIKKKIVSGLN